MKKWVEDLLLLQDGDLKIRRLRMRLEMIPKEIAALKEDLKKAEEDLKSKSEFAKKTELGIKKVESDTAAEKTEIQRLQKQSTMVKKNDEYRALMNEIEHHQKKISEQETKEIGLLDELDEAKKLFQSFQKEFEARRASINEEITELSEHVGEIEQQIKRLLEARPGLEAYVETSVLRMYNRLLNGNRGVPFSAIENENCGNCHLKVTPQTYHNAKAGQLAQCDHCMHLLYILKS